MNELSYIADTIAEDSSASHRSATNWVAVAMGICLICLMRQTVFAVTETHDMAASQKVGTAIQDGDLRAELA